MVFDEYYYVNAARNIIGRPMLFGYEGELIVITNNSTPTVVTRYCPLATEKVYPNVTKLTDPNSEHPPLAKLIVAFSALLLGENALAYRLPSAVFGALLLLFLYLALKKLTTDQVAFYAATFLAFETLTFVHSSIFMLDIFMVSLMVLGFCIFLRGHYIAAGVVIGLSALSKEMGIIGLAIVMTFLVLDQISSHTFKIKESAKLIAKVVIGLVLPVVLLSALIAVWWKVSPSQQFQNIVSLGGIRVDHYNLDGSYVDVGSSIREFGIISPPWTWILNGNAIEYFNGVVGGHLVVKYEVAMNPMLIYLMLPAVAYSIWHYWKARDRADLFALVWWAWSYMVMYPLAFTGRVMYIFYMLPTMGAISIMVASLMCHPSMNRYVRILYLALLIVGMLLQFPVKLFT
jgi:predicted membrane-bound dolichyl-phosphate-mannose-protein mannosyltransferase